MRKTVSMALAASTALTSSVVLAQDVAPQSGPPAVSAAAPTAASPTPAATDNALGQIVVTARRDAENLQRVPVSVQVVTGDTLQKESITQAAELSKLAPGLTLSGTPGDSTTTAITLRGITFKPGSGTPATPVYFNEIPFDPFQTIQSLYDISEIEVLRGPQGTTRGAPSISGAITITTKKPDLDSLGGYAQGQYGEGRTGDAQGAVNVPLIKGVLAVRAAADYGTSEANRVTSITSSIDPRYRSKSYRVTALFQPTETLTIQGMWQRRDNFTRLYGQVVGAGSPGAAGIPANFNGPELTDSNRKSVQDAPDYSHQRADLITLNASWEVAGQKLTYNYGRQIDRSGPQQSTLDEANVLPGYEPFSTAQPRHAFFQTNEVRLSSLADDSRPFDYDVGWFQKYSRGDSVVDLPVFLPGAFGAPGTAPGVVTSPDSRYVLPTHTNAFLLQKFDAFYGNLRAHLGENTELSGGFSVINEHDKATLDVTTGAAFNAFANPIAGFGLPCEALAAFSPAAAGTVSSPTYPGFCDAPVPAGAGNTTQNFDNKYSRALYNFSLSHRFSDKVLAYATTGTSFRTGLPAIGQNGLPDSLEVPKPEKATSYEVGVKTTINRFLRVNADIYQINYGNQLTQFLGVPYYDSVSGQTTNTTGAFYGNVNARVRGAEAEISARPFTNLTLAANFSYSKIVSRGGAVPCNNPAGPAITAGNPINFCNSPSGQTLNQLPPFQATLNGSYTIPLGPLNGYLRANADFQGHNPNFGNAPTADGEFTPTKAYVLVDLFAGITGPRGKWEIGLFAKNVLNEQKELNRTGLIDSVYSPYAAAATGYSQVILTLPREIGATLRYSFGSR